MDWRSAPCGTAAPSEGAWVTTYTHMASKPAEIAIMTRP